MDTIAGKIERGDALQVVNDQRGSPTYTRDLAHGIARLLGRGATGVVHVTNRGEATWHDLAVAIGRFLGATAAIEPIPTSRMPRPAARPAYSVLSGKRYEALAGKLLPSWEEALHHYLAMRPRSAGSAA